MKKVYPYLDNPYRNNINEQTERQQFLSKIDDFINQKQYVRITLLNWQENGIKELEGELTSGSITKDGASTIRRTCTFSCSVNGGEYNVEDMKMDFAINKKIYLEIGIKNYTNEYPEYPILWFPQGVFYITGLSITSSSTTSVNLSLNLKDKMASLNGEIGGMFSSTTILDTVDTQTENGEYITEKVPVYSIIQEVVHHFGGELLSNIVIEDVPLRIQRVMRWMGSNPLWIIQESTDINMGISYKVQVETPTDSQLSVSKQYNAGDDVGYIYDDFYYTDELVMAPGDSVCTALDKIIQYLGNYEYFYDEFGVFHFREIKNYLNTTQATVVTAAQEADDYLVDITTGKSIFNFTDDKNLINISVNPQYNNIKNDYVVQGLKKGTIDNLSYPIMYHLAIDYKPTAGNTYRDLLLYKCPSDGLIKAAFPAHQPELPEVGNFNVLYMLDYDEEQVWFWSESNEYVQIEVIHYFPQNEDSVGYTTKDWRTEIYLRGLLANNLGTDASHYFTTLNNNESSADSGYPWIDDLFNVTRHEKINVDFYFTELSAFWPMIYDLENQRFWAEEEDPSLDHVALTQGNYYLDFIDPSVGSLGEFCINNIGRRSLVVSNEQINCLFEPEIPDINFLNKDLNEEELTNLRNECKLMGKPYAQVPGDIYYALATGGYHFSCFNEIKYQLFLHTNYAKTLSIIALPAFYLEPNSRVTINDASTNTYGDYMITNVTIPLGAGNTMSCAASECNMDRLQ